MLRIILILALFSFSCHGFFPTPMTANASTKEQSNEFVAFDSFPAPVGGFETLAMNVKYPESGLESGTQGKVLVEVFFDSAGSISNIVVKESLGADFDSAALKAITDTKWTPAMAGGQSVSCQVVIPIQFKLDNNKKSEKK